MLYTSPSEICFCVTASEARTSRSSKTTFPIDVTSDSKHKSENWRLSGGNFFIPLPLAHESNFSSPLENHSLNRSILRELKINCCFCLLHLCFPRVFAFRTHIVSNKKCFRVEYKLNLLRVAFSELFYSQRVVEIDGRNGIKSAETSSNKMFLLHCQASCRIKFEFLFAPLFARRSETIVQIANMTPLWYLSVVFWSHVKLNYHWVLTHVPTRWGLCVCSHRFWLKIMFAVKSVIDGRDKYQRVCLSLEAEPQLFIQINHPSVCVLGRWCVSWF